MNIKLCYMDYPFRFTLGACKQFYDKTGRDLQQVLVSYIQATTETREMDLIARMNAFLCVVPFEVAAEAICALAQTENKSVSISDIRDGMFKVSWLPTEVDNDYQEPWPLVMLDIANQVNDYFTQNQPVKKKAIKAEDQK